MNVTQNIIKDIEDLRGATVRIFGQPSHLPDAVGDFEIDVIEILKALNPLFRHTQMSLLLRLL